MSLSCGKKLSALLRGITLKHHDGFCFPNCLYSFATKSKREFHKNECKNKDLSSIVMPSEDTELLEFNQYKENDKAPFIIYADLKYLVEKIVGCKNNPENSSAIKIGEYIPSGFSMSKISSFKSIEKRHNVYRGKDCMKKFCESLRVHAMKIINFKKKKLSH